jgi:hypothetical protein
MKELRQLQLRSRKEDQQRRMDEFWMISQRLNRFRIRINNKKTFSGCKSNNCRIISLQYFLLGFRFISFLFLGNFKTSNAPSLVLFMALTVNNIYNCDFATALLWTTPYLKFEASKKIIEFKVIEIGEKWFTGKRSLQIELRY